MKPEDRSLDVAVVGLGQAGGNLAAQFLRLGYRAIALNTASTDLSALGEGSHRSIMTPEQRLYIGIDGYDGAGGDLNYGRDCIRENTEQIRKAVMDHAGDADVVLITAGLGGGTGSAASELVKALEDLQLPVLVLATLPTENESGVAKVNAMRGLAALVQRSGVSRVFVDNSRLARRHSDVGADEYFETINGAIAAPLDSFNRLNHSSDLIPIRTLDGEDLRRLLLSGGVIHYATDQLPGLDVAGVVQSIRGALESGSLMPEGTSLDQIATMGVVIQAPEAMFAHTPFSFFERLSEQIKDATRGAATCVGVYRSRSGTGAARLQLICSSFQLPNGISKMLNDARHEGGILQEKLHKTLVALDVGELEELDLTRSAVRGGPAQRNRRRSGDDGSDSSASSPYRGHRAAPAGSNRHVASSSPSADAASSRINARSTAGSAEPRSAATDSRVSPSSIPPASEARPSTPTISSRSG